MPPRDVVDIAGPAPLPSQPVAALEPPPTISAPTVETRRPDPPAASAAVVTSAVIRQRRIPAYPAALANEGIEGQVIAVFYVGAGGKPDDVRIERSPHPLLSQAVVDALKGWRFDPARAADGSAVRTRMRLPFSFRVE